MLRNSLRPVRDLVDSMSPRRRIWSLVIGAVGMLVMIGFINLAPVPFEIKLGVIILIPVIATCFLYSFLVLRSKNLNDEKETGVEHNDRQSKIPPMPRRLPTAGTEKLNIETRPIKLSSFASRRIAKQQPILKNSQPILEQRISKSELFVQLEKRRPTGETVKRIWSKKPRKVFEPRKTIWVELLWCSVASFLFLYVIWLGFFSGPVIDGVSRIALIIFATIFVVATVIKLFIKWAYWYCWRLLLFRANEEEGVDAKVVIIDKPFLIPGGSVPSVDLRILRLVSSATAREIKDERSFESILAGWLGVEWLLLDTYGQGDARFNWMGPFRNAPMLVAIFDHERRKARLEDQ